MYQEIIGCHICRSLNKDSTISTVCGYPSHFTSVASLTRELDDVFWLHLHPAAS